MNSLLDLAILLPMSRMTLGTYFSAMALRYVLIPFMAGAMSTLTVKEHVQ